MFGLKCQHADIRMSGCWDIGSQDENETIVCLHSYVEWLEVKMPAYQSMRMLQLHANVQLLMRKVGNMILCANVMMGIAIGERVD